MKTAVVYYSLEGNTEYAALKVAEALGADVIRIRPRKAYPTEGFKKFFHGGKDATFKSRPELEPYSFSRDDHDLVILCSPVWAGTLTPPLRSFLAENDLRGMKVAVMVSSSGGNTAKCISQIREAAGVGTLEAEVSLVDPKTRPSEENERRIAAFIEELENIRRTEE